MDVGDCIEDGGALDVRSATNAQRIGRLGGRHMTIGASSAARYWKPCWVGEERSATASAANASMPRRPEIGAEGGESHKRQSGEEDRKGEPGQAARELFGQGRSGGGDRCAALAQDPEFGECRGFRKPEVDSQRLVAGRDVGDDRPASVRRREHHSPVADAHGTVAHVLDPEEPVLGYGRRSFPGGDEREQFVQAVFEESQVVREAEIPVRCRLPPGCRTATNMTGPGDSPGPPWARNRLFRPPASRRRGDETGSSRTARTAARAAARSMRSRRQSLDRCLPPAAGA